MDFFSRLTHEKHHKTTFFSIENNYCYSFFDISNIAHAMLVMFMVKTEAARVPIIKEKSKPFDETTSHVTFTTAVAIHCP